MSTAAATLHPAFRVGTVDRRLFGSFVEHLGRCVYTGIYEPGHPTATAEGFRGDVLELVRELGVTTIRYPGGNFVSSYRWEDGVGPVESRPTRLDLAWHSTETNEFGLNEFMRWCSLAGVEPLMAVNIGTRGTAEAVELLEYCNVPSGTALSDLRREHGVDAPHNVRMWCLGNEMDGPWQVGQMTPEGYGRAALDMARAMRLVDKDLELVACGSSGRFMPTFGEWERVVLEHTYEVVAFISAHAYYEEENGDLASFLASATDMDCFIAGVVATADAVGAAKHSDKKIAISFDEWNVWYLNRPTNPMPTGHDWPIAPRLLEDVYTLADAVVVGDLLITLLRNADRVKAASLAQVVNVIGPIMTEPGGPAWRQSTFHPFALTARHAGSIVLRTEVDSPTFTTAKHGDAALVSSVVTWDESKQVTVFAVNRDASSAHELRLDLAALGKVASVESTTLTGDDPYAVNTADAPDTVSPRPGAARSEGGEVTAALPPLSWNMVRITLA
jgi:alpha-N-arabinofuranosidase